MLDPEVSEQKLQRALIGRAAFVPATFATPFPLECWRKEMIIVKTKHAQNISW